jgi:hypothetical protein
MRTLPSTMPRKPSAKTATQEKTPPSAQAETEVVEGEDGEAAPPSATDNVGDISVEVNVEDLIAQIESESKGGPVPDGLARRKIEDIIEEKRVAREIMDLDDFDIDD